MRLRHEARVGLVVTIAIVALLLGYMFLTGVGLRSNTYTVYAVFGNVMRLSDGADVRMAGVRIGKVGAIWLTSNRAAGVPLIISRRYSHIPKDSVARITTGGLTGFGEYYVEIVPGSSRSNLRPGDYVNTVEAADLDKVVDQVREIVTSLQNTMKAVEKIVTDNKNQQAIAETLENIRIVSANIGQLVDDARKMLGESRPDINRVLDSAAEAAKNLEAVSKDVRVAVEKGGINQLQETLASAKSAADNLEAATARLRKLAEDPEIDAQIRGTLKNAYDAAAGAAALVDKAQRVLSVGGGKSRNGSGGIVLGKGARFDAYAKSNGDFRFDFNYTFPGRGREFYRIGLYDIGERNKLNAQIGRKIDDQSSIRYGFYSSRIGVGYDKIINDKLDIQLDMYRPNDPTLEAKLGYEFAPHWKAVIGVEDLFEGEGGMVGVQYHK